MPSKSENIRNTDPNSHRVEAELTFIAPSDTKPVFESAAYTGGEPKLYFEMVTHRVRIKDVRPIAGDLSLDRQGFELHSHTSGVKDFYDDDEIEGQYYEEVEAFLKNRFNASQVVVFDVTRRVDSSARRAGGTRAPAGRIHVDYTRKSGPHRARDALGEDVFKRLRREKARVVQVNLWRPIRGPVRRSPLAIADAGSVRPQDLIATDQIFPGRIGEIYHLAYNDSQRWYYAPRMNVDEVLLIKGWDSLDDGRARYTPHGAFQLPEIPDCSDPRESIEVRTFVVVGH